MELARALTNRRRQGSDAHYTGPARAASTRSGPIKRSAISNPVELISTTNALAYNAPNIYGSSDESDRGSASSLGMTSRATTPETSPDESPIEPNHLSIYFPQRRNTTRSSKDSSDSETPKIPQRAPSHTKKSHQYVARKRASSRATPPPNTIVAPIISQATPEMLSSQSLADHPFGAEIAEVNKVAEKFGTREAMILDEEEQFLINNGLCKFGADDYVDEIQSLFGGSQNNPFGPFSPVWI